MRTITISESRLARHLNRRAQYARDVIERGHQPGVLSGAELKGKARQYSANYARQRRNAVAAVQAATDGQVSDGYLQPHNRRVWVDGAGHPVRLRIEE